MKENRSNFTVLPKLGKPISSTLYDFEIKSSFDFFLCSSDLDPM